MISMNRGLFLIALSTSSAAFAFSAASHPLTTIYDFCSLEGCKDGFSGLGLAADQSGNVYGATGGTGNPRHEHSAIYELKGGKRYKRLYSFNDTESSGAPLVIDTAGDLYGTTSGGGAYGEGAAYELMPAANGKWTYKSLYDFCAQGGKKCTDGAVPWSGLIYAGQQSGALYDGASPLYGSTVAGGSANAGTVYQLTPQKDGSWSQSVLYNFCSLANCADGYDPGQILVGSDGGIFGETIGGGGADEGTDFQLTGSGGTWTETVIHSFCNEANCTDGMYPDALVEGTDGNLYGLTAWGGAPCTNALTGSCGLLYELAPNGSAWTFSVLYQFCSEPDCSDGALPAGLTIDPSGNLFGTTNYGGNASQGNYGGGVLFEWNNGRLRVLYDFCSQGGDQCTDGNNPDALVFGPHGYVYGTTVDGANDYGNTGTVYRIKP